MNAEVFSRRAFLGATSAFALAAATGCSSEDGKGGSTGGGSIKVADPSYTQEAYKTGMDAISKKFTEATGASVEQVAPPSAQYTTTILTQLQAGSPPDVIRIDDPNLANWVSKSWLLPVDDAVKAAGHTVNDLVPANKDAVIDGKLYGVVKESNPRVYIYNKKLYKDAGVGAPTDLASFEDAIRKTTDAGSGVYGIGFNTKQGDPTTLFIQLMPFVYGFGGSFFDGKTPTATAPEVLQALEFLQMVWKDNLCPRGIDAVTINSLVGQGKVACTINGSFVIIQGRTVSPDTAGDLTTAPNPLPGGITMRASALWGVPADAKNPDLGKKYIQALLDTDAEVELQKATGVIPALRKGIGDEFLKDNPWFSSVVDAAWDSKTLSYFPLEIGASGSKAISVIGDGIFDMLYNETAPEAAMKKVQEQLESAL